MQMHIGEKLLALRTQKNMTQEELAERLGVTRQSVSKWESNGTFPNMNKLLEICDLFQVSLDYLLRDMDGQAAPQTELPYEAPEHPAGKKQRSVYLMLSMILTGVLFAVCCFLFGGIYIHHIWDINSGEEKLLHVDTIYEQYTKAKVSVNNGKGKYEDQVLWLDVDGVKENDWVFGYGTNAGAKDVRVKYEVRTLLLPGLLALVFLSLFFLLYMELRRGHASRKG